MDQAVFAYLEVLRQLRESGEVANLDRRVGLCPRGYRQEALEFGRLALHFATDIVGHAIRENPLVASASGRRLQNNQRSKVQPTESIRFLTGQ